jgi:hypothetical protein
MPLMIGGDITEKQFLDESLQGNLEAPQPTFRIDYQSSPSQSKKYSWVITPGPPNSTSLTTGEVKRLVTATSRTRFVNS